MKTALIPTLSLLLSACCYDPQPEVSPPVPPAAAPTLDPLQVAVEQEDLAKHQAGVDEARKFGWVGDLNVERQEIVAGPGFAALDFKVKEAIIFHAVIVIAKTKKTTNVHLDVLDPKTNKPLGTYDLARARLTME